MNGYKEDYPGIRYRETWYNGKRYTVVQGYRYHPAPGWYRMWSRMPLAGSMISYPEPEPF